MDEVVVKAYKNKGEAHNYMAMISARSISPEETKRFAGGYDDPSHILKNFAGVSQTASGNNDIIVRGNSIDRIYCDLLAWSLPAKPDPAFEPAI